MKLNYLIGDATLPIKKPAIIVHIVNDIGCWGSGFVVAISNRFGKNSESSYKLWSRTTDSDFRLGSIQITSTPDKEIKVVNMVAQTGIISIKNPKPLHLKALNKCLSQVYKTIDKNVTVHMPRIGCGLAGGIWEEVEPIIQKHMSVDTYVYDLQ